MMKFCAVKAAVSGGWHRPSWWSCVELLHRTDFFPGLGWMFLRDTWLEIRLSWPTAYAPVCLGNLIRTFYCSLFGLLRPVVLEVIA